MQHFLELEHEKGRVGPKSLTRLLPHAGLRLLQHEVVERHVNADAVAALRGFLFELEPLGVIYLLAY